MGQVHARLKWSRIADLLPSQGSHIFSLVRPLDGCMFVLGSLIMAILQLQ